MNKTLNYILKGVKVLIILVGIILTYMTLDRWDSKWGEGTDVFGLKILAAHPELSSPLTGVVYLCYVLIVFTFAIMLLFWLVRLASDIKAGLPSILGVVVIVVIAFIAYNMASDFMDPTWNISAQEKADIMEGNWSKKADAGIYMAMIMGIITLGAIVVTEVRGIIK